jgi:hypothetical protein
MNINISDSILETSTHSKLIVVKNNQYILFIGTEDDSLSPKLEIT